MTGENGTGERLRQLERRLEASEADRKDIWRHQGRIEQAMAVKNEKLEFLREDVAGLRGQITWLVRGVFGMLVTGITILIQALTSGQIG